MRLSNNLVILDVSPFIYTGENSASTEPPRVKQFPVKGINYFLKFLSAELVNCCDMILCFDSASFRKSIDTNYKANRSHNANVSAQLELLYTYLPKYGFTCLKQEGVEADDIIFTCVEKYKRKYRNIDIYTADKDICHNVGPNVNCLAINSNTVDVYKHTYEDLLGVPYNTISASKLFKGDRSDNIPPFSPNAQELFEQYISLLRKLDQITPEMAKTKEFMYKAIDVVYTQLFDEKKVNELRKRVELIYPKKVEFDFDYEPCSYSSIDKLKFASFLYTLGNTVSLQSLGLDGSWDKSLESYLQRMGDSLCKGFYAIDNSIIENCEKMNMDSFMLRGF